MFSNINIILIVYLAFLAYQDWKQGKVLFTDLLLGLLIGLASFVLNPRPYSLLFIVILLVFAAIQRKLNLDFVGEADIYVLAIVFLILPTMQSVYITILSLILAVFYNVVAIKLLHLKFFKHPELSNGITGIPIILMITLLSYFF